MLAEPKIYQLQLKVFHKEKQTKLKLSCIMLMNKQHKYAATTVKSSIRCLCGDKTSTLLLVVFSPTTTGSPVHLHNT